MKKKFLFIKIEISGGSVENLSEMEQNFFMRKIINLIRIEYIEKQKLVINEFQKRFVYKLKY